MPLRTMTGVPIPTAPPAAPRAAAAIPEAPAGVGPMVIPPSVDLPVPQVPQLQTEWCWAACTEMVARWLGVDGVRQCELANFLHGQTRCCTAPSSDACNQPAPFASVIPVYRHVGVAGIGPDRPLTANTLVAELAAGRAVEVAFAWVGGGGHVVIVHGYTAEGLFAVNDPWQGAGTVSYFNLLTAYGSGRWVASYGRFARA